MDVWNYAKNSAGVAWDSIGGNAFAAGVLTVLDEVSQRFIQPIVLTAVPGGTLGIIAANYYNNMLLLTKLTLKQSV